MKKIFSALLLAVMLLTSTAAFAAYKEDIPEGADLASVKRLAIAFPQHYKVEDTEPTADEFAKVIFAASRVARCYVISYDEIAANILRDTGVDITALSDLEARKIYNENVAKYADAFLTVATANNIKKVQFFFEVQNAQSGEMVYLLTTQNGELGKNSKDYLKACENFYKQFDKAAEKSIKDAAKKSKKDK